MKRDMDLVREILKKLNSYKHGYAPDNFVLNGFSNELVSYHCYLLNDAGLIEALDNTDISSKSPSAIPLKLTWAGHEFIENALNEKSWLETKEAISKIGDVSFSVWSSVLSKVVLSNLGFGS
jgi:hypothetical protein